MICQHGRPGGHLCPHCGPHENSRKLAARSRARELLALRHELDEQIRAVLTASGAYFARNADWQCTACNTPAGGGCELCTVCDDGSSPPAGIHTLAWLHIDRYGDTSCWPWIGKLRNGYADLCEFMPGHHAGHRTIFVAFNPGVDISDLVVHHLCRVKHCLNPDHLEAMSPSAHSRRHWEQDGSEL